MGASLKGKKALIVGGSKGIGAAMSKKLASEGAFVIVNYAHGKASADETVRQIQEAGGKENQ